MSFLESTELHEQMPSILNESAEGLNDQILERTKRIFNKEYKSGPNIIDDNKSYSDLMELEETLTINTSHNQKYSNLNKKNQFDSIVKNVNETINKLNNVYQQIGFSSEEISLKKSEIFTVIEDTISNFATGLQREKNNIENECEWLRQQIKIILAMVNDNNGDKYLGLMEKGIVYNDRNLYEQGYKDEKLKINLNIPNNSDFYARSPFNLDSDISQDKDYQTGAESEYEIPELSLIKLRGKLNTIFLDAIKIFMRSFKQLNELTIIYLDYSDALGQVFSKDSNQSLLNNLPNKDEADMHREIINEFEVVLNNLKLPSNNSKTDSLMNSNSKNVDEYSFVIPSPRKAILKENNQLIKNPNNNQLKKAGPLNHLQDINYKIVQIIRSLKFTKITPESLSSIQREIEFCEGEYKLRRQKMCEIVSNSLQIINQLQLSNEQLMKIQNQFNLGKQVTSDVSNDSYFDVETLNFIQSNPKHFGLNDTHMDFLGNFANILERIRDSKQNKWNSYLKACKSLWSKLSVTQDYIESFLELNNSLTDKSLMNFKIELKKLYAKRSEFIDNFIIDARLEIEKFWDKMYYSKEQRLLFKYYNFDVRDEGADKERVLNEHEIELEKLKEEFNAKEIIIQLYNQLNELAQDQIFLRESSKDSSRLLSKNSCKILLNEEKIRKKINRNMPKVLECLKLEVKKYNEEQSNGEKGIMMIDGEDFYERLLAIESEQLSQGNCRNNRNKHRIQDSPSKTKEGSRKASPSKPGSKSPNLHSKLPSRFSVASRKSPTSPWKSHSIKRIASNSKTQKVRPYGNHIANRLTNAINLSLGVENYTTGLEGPSMIASHSKSNTLATQLLPLNTPLVASGKNMDSNTTISSFSKLSPLGLNRNISNNLRQNSQCSLSPQTMSYNSINDKENSILELSPIKLLDSNKLEENNKNNESPGNISFGYDSSTIIGDDYQQWRDEKIKQLNEIM